MQREKGQSSIDSFLFGPLHRPMEPLQRLAAVQKGGSFSFGAQDERCGSLFTINKSLIESGGLFQLRDYRVLLIKES
jgi:hypothetical protein